MHPQKRYVGVDEDINGGMTATAKIVRDAWVFGLLPATETCAGWTAGQIEALWERVDDEWRKHDFRVAALPEALRARFLDLHGAAVARARASGWDGAQELAADG